MRRIGVTGLLCTGIIWAQIPTAPNTQPKPVGDPLNTSNVTGDPAAPGGNPGLTTNPSSGISDQMREAADQIFAQNLALESMTDAELGKLAATQAGSPAVKTFAKEMIEDHGKISQRLKRIAARGHVTIPATLDAKHQARVDKLAKLSGDEFDRAFIRDQVLNHERSLRRFEQELQNGADPGLRTLASRTLPSMRQHLEAAKDLEKTQKAK
ncbi:MAG: DUF4142 domain-containing protein [Acidobacteriota bacterium]|nr:DUF4142 domain-containing protein [Acidobacteriota bacterium]